MVEVSGLLAGNAEGRADALALPRLHRLPHVGQQVLVAAEAEVLAGAIVFVPEVGRDADGLARGPALRNPWHTAIVAKSAGAANRTSPIALAIRRAWE